VFSAPGKYLVRCGLEAKICHLRQHSGKFVLKGAVWQKGVWFMQWWFLDGKNVQNLTDLDLVIA
jgi:hypothetical protein